jgi:hypothetical protein
MDDACIPSGAVADEPPKKWRILEPGEVVCSGDRVNAKTNPPSDPPNGLGWIPAGGPIGRSVLKDDEVIFARPVADEPAKKPEPAWEPKVGDWVKVTRPEDWIEWDFPKCEGWMHHFDGKVGRIQEAWGNNFQIVGFANENSFRCELHPSWLSPAEPPEPEYREPVLPADAGKECEFSDDGNAWTEGKLRGYTGFCWQNYFVESVGEKWWAHARIKKDA